MNQVLVAQTCASGRVANPKIVRNTRWLDLARAGPCGKNQPWIWYFREGFLVPFWPQKGTAEIRF